MTPSEQFDVLATRIHSVAIRCFREAVHLAESQGVAIPPMFERHLAEEQFALAEKLVADVLAYHRKRLEEVAAERKPVQVNGRLPQGVKT